MEVATVCLYEYGCDIDLIEWDIDYLKEKYKDKLNEKINPQYKDCLCWEEFIKNLEISINNNEFLNGILEELYNLFEIHYYEDSSYLVFNNINITKLFPDSELKDLHETALIYAKELGIKNTKIIDSVKYGYLD